MTIFRRWWWLILLPAVAAAALAALTYRAPGTAYAGGLRYTAGQPATLAQSPGYDPNYYRWLTSEYIVTALKDWVRTGEFAQAVSARLAQAGRQIDPGALRGALITDNARSILTVSLVWPNPDDMGPIFDAITAVLQANNAAVFPQLGGQAAQVVPLDSLVVGAVPPALRQRLDVPLKLALGLAAGLGLALLAHFLDPFVRDRQDAERLGLAVVGEIPRK
jgi:hypothetical protein